MRYTPIAVRFAGALAGVALFASVASADLAAIKKNCNFKPEPTHVLIDANTGKVTGGTRFNAGVAVQVVIEHKNPFKYRYRVEVTAAPLEESVAANFFKLIPGLSAMGSGTGIPIAGAPAPVTAGFVAPACAPPHDTNWTAVDAALTAAKASRGALAASFDDRVAIYKTYETFVKDTDVDQLPAPCTTLCETAAKLADTLGKLIDLGDVPDKAKAFSAAASTLSAALAAFRSATPPATCTTAHKDELAEADALVAKAAEVQKQIDEIKAAAASFKAMQTLLNNVLEEMYPFNEPFYPPTVGNATGVTVVVFRTNLRQVPPKELKIATVFIQIGESLVSVSAGLGFTFTPVRTIGRVASLVPGADGKDTLGNRFEYLENSGQRAVAIAMLNGRLPRPPAKSAWARFSPDVLSTGVGFSLDGGPSQSEWLPVAVGWRAGSDHVLFVVGLHLTRSDCLPDANDKSVPCSSRTGFKLGDVVPAGLADPLPVERIWTKGILVGVTFRTQ